MQMVENLIDSRLRNNLADLRVDRAVSALAAKRGWGQGRRFRGAGGTRGGSLNIGAVADET